MTNETDSFVVDTGSTIRAVDDKAVAKPYTDLSSNSSTRLSRYFEGQTGSESSLAGGSDTDGSNTSNGCTKTGSSVDEETTTESSSVDDSMQAALLHDNAIPRWKALEEKRLALCRKRVQLERRLFESTFSQPNSTPDPTGIELPPEARDGTVTSPPPLRLVANFRAQISDEQPVVTWSGRLDTTGLATGQGRMVFSDGQIYDGVCHEGLRHGRGRTVWPSSSPTSMAQVYTGEWVRGHREGRGTHCWPDGRTVTGTWKLGHLNGRVFFSWPDGASYDGDTAAGIKQGRGTHTWADGRVYSGQYQDGYEHGVGMLTEASRRYTGTDEQHSQYRGQFKHGARHGYGVQIWPNKTYDGEWSQNVVHGMGKLTWNETGASYTGQFSQGVYHGVGCYSSSGGMNKYVGHWHFGVKQGKGKRYWSDGRVYEGSFRRSRPCGFGHMTYPNGATYKGGWLNGEFSGWGIAMAVDGKTVVHCGMWSNNHPASLEETSKHNDSEERRGSTDDISTPQKGKLGVCREMLTLRCHSYDDMNWHKDFDEQLFVESGDVD